jgi:transposase
MVLKKGLRSLAVGFLPAKADPKVQRNFLEHVLKPLIERAKNNDIDLFFMDASHFVMGGFPGRLWSVVRRFVKTASGRKRYNVLGALNFVSKQVESVCNDSYITATQVVEILEKLADKYGKSIFVVLDNARYQKCEIVFNAAERLGIHLVYLPTYSPNLNLIERVWKLVKSKVLNSAYFETFADFSKNISKCVNTLHSDLRDEMLSIITENFQIVDENMIVNK